MIKLPDSTTEVQAAVIEMQRAQKKNVFKFGAFVIFLVGLVMTLLWFVASVSELSRPAIKSLLGEF